MKYFHQRWAIWFSKNNSARMLELIYDKNPVYPAGRCDEADYPAGGTKFRRIEDAVKALEWCKAHYDPEKYHFVLATYSMGIDEGVG